MALNTSNASLHPPPLSSPTNMYNLVFGCFNSTVGVYSITAFTVTNSLLILPLSVLIIALGYQRWRQQQQHSSTMSHSDLFTYHMIVVELIGVLGATVICCGVHTFRTGVVMLGIYLCSFYFSGQMLFHILTCVERYLAVVHPVTYLGLRQAKGIRIRNIVVGCVWLLCFAAICYKSAADHVFIFTFYFCVLGVTAIVVCFCSISVLCVLIRPGPGEGGGDRQRVDQSKLRAFYTIVAILGVLLLRFGGITWSTALFYSPLLGKDEQCTVWLSELWFCLPSSLVLPLLFLHRAGKLSCCKNNNTSGQGSD